MGKFLNEVEFRNAMRASREYVPYLRTLYSQMIKTGHPILAANVCAFVLRQGDDNFFSKS